MINIGIIGCGRIASHHCEANKKINGLTLSAVCDLDYTKAQELAKKFKTSSYKNYHEMLKGEERNQSSHNNYSLRYAF